MSVDFRLDRTAYSEMSFAKADKAINDFSNSTWQERLIVANRLTAIAYNYPINNKPPMDKTVFEIIKHG
jgi:hypothetical protein